MEDKKNLNNRKLDDHLGTQFEVPSEEGHNWTGQEAQVNSDPIEDSGTGTTRVIRFFEFNLNPAYKGQWMHKQEIFNAHKDQIRTFLWRDGLIPTEDIPPRVLIDKKKGKYKIVVLCEPYSIHGVKQTITERAQNVQDIIKNAQSLRRDRK